jgi:hypothetical protein
MALCIQPSDALKSSQNQVQQHKTMPFPSKVPSSDHTCPEYKAALEAQYTAATLLLLHHTLFFCPALPHC